MYNIDQPKPAMVFTAVRFQCDTKMAAVFSCMRPTDTVTYKLVEDTLTETPVDVMVFYWQV